MDMARTLINSALNSFADVHPHGHSKILNAFLSTAATAYVLAYGPERAAQVLYAIADEVAVTNKQPPEENE